VSCGFFDIEQIEQYLDAVVDPDVFPHRSESFGVPIEATHQPNKAKCSLHDLILTKKIKSCQPIEKVKQNELPRAIQAWVLLMLLPE